MFIGAARMLPEVVSDLGGHGKERAMTEAKAYLRSPARRQVLTGMAGISLAALLADPVRVAQAAASLKTITTKTASGRTVSAALALPAQVPAGGVMIVHEWWGLNDQIKSVAAQLAEENFVALAIDLYDGKTASDPGTAQQLMGGVKDAEATETVTTWLDQLYAMKEVNGKVATLGFCFGGGWSLNASLAHPVDATVIYYGRVDKSPEELKKLKGPVLGHFGGKDTYINPPMVDGFEAAMKQDGKPAEIYRYADANHAFANPTGQSYEKEDARVAWDRTVAFLKKTIG
jgi:carboxymethylenebutenolidase